MVEADVGKSVKFGTLDVLVRTCFKSPPTSKPEAVAFLEIRENKAGNKDMIFSGWMFASSPALSSLEHAVYDVWLLSCEAKHQGVAQKKPDAGVTKQDDAVTPSEETKPSISQMD